MPNLTTAQKTILKADILADPVLSLIPNTPDGAFQIADAYNLIATPDWWVWRTYVERKEYVETTTSEATVFSWTTYIGRSVGERDAFREMFNHTGAVNPSLPNVRQGFVDIFSGATAGAPVQRTHMATVSRRKATRAEKLFSTGVGSTASPATMAFEGPLGYADVFEARNS